MRKLLKKSKKIASYALVLSMIISNLIAVPATQANGTTLTIGSQSASNGDAISVPLTADVFVDVAGMDFSVQYDNTLLTYTGYTPVVLNHGNLSINDTGSKVIVNWFDTSNPLNLNSEVLLTLEFTVISNASVNADLEFVGTLEMNDSQANPISATFIDGVITLNPVSDTTPPTITSYTLNGNESNATFNPGLGETVEIVLNASENVNWTSLTIEKDDDSGIYKRNYPGADCDGFSQCVRTWSGLLSVPSGTIVDGAYKIKVNIKDAAENTFTDYVTPYVIIVDTATGNTPPVMQSVTLNPDPAYTNSDINAISGVYDGEGDVVTFSYQWKKNDGNIGDDSPILASSNFVKDDVIKVIVTPNDGTEDGNPMESDPLTISNSAPTQPTVSVLPDPAYTDNDLTCNPSGSVDADGDGFSYAYQWYKNGAIQNGYTLDTVLASQTMTGNVWKCEVVADDGEAQSVVGEDSVVILETPDDASPVIAEVTPVPTPANDNTPEYTFSSTEAGTIAYTDGCVGDTNNAVAGNNTVTFNELTDGTYGSCTIMVTDIDSNDSNVLTVSSFTVDTVAPVVEITSPIDGFITNQLTIVIEYIIDQILYSDDEVLEEGENTVVRSDTDEAGNVGSDSIAVILDTTPPVRSNGSPTGELSAGTTQTALSLTTDENATCGYTTTAGAEYGAMTVFSATNSTTHSTSVTGLTDGNAYSYYVKCQDGLENTNTDDYQISFSVASPSSGGGGGGVYVTLPINTSITINNGESNTTDENVTLTLLASDVVQMAISNSSDFIGISWETYTTSKEWTLTSINGEKTVYAKFRSSNGGASPVVSDNIILNSANLGGKVKGATIVTIAEVFDGDIIQCQSSDNPYAIYIVKEVDNVKYIRHIVFSEILDYYDHLDLNNLKQVDSLNGYLLSSWVRINTGPNGAAAPTDKVWEINADQTKHWVNMTAEQFLIFGGSEAAIFSINEEELNLYTTGHDIVML